MPSFTFAATINAVLWAGLEPVFVDVEARAWHLDPARLEQALAERAGSAAAVLACSTFGMPPPAAQRAAWEAAARRRGRPADRGLRGGLRRDRRRRSRAGPPGRRGGLLVPRDEAVRDRRGRPRDDDRRRDRAPAAAAHQLRLRGRRRRRRRRAQRQAAGVVGGDGAGGARRLRRGARPPPRVRAADAGRARGARLRAPGGDRGGGVAVRARPGAVPRRARRGARGGPPPRASRCGPTSRCRCTGCRPSHRFPSAGGLRCTDDLAERALSLPMANDLSPGDMEAIVDSLAPARRHAR